MFKKIIFFLLLLPTLLTAEPAECKVFFSPKDQLADRLIELINKEERSIKVAIYSMTHLGIAKALIAAKGRGVAVEVIADPISIKSRSPLQRLSDAKIPLFIWDQKMCQREGKKKGLMHDKFCIFGDHSVWTGSFNFTHDANSIHQENALAIQGRGIAQKYLTQFSQMQLYECRPYQEYLTLYPKKMGGKKLPKPLSLDKGV